MYANHSKRNASIQCECLVSSRVAGISMKSMNVATLMNRGSLMNVSNTLLFTLHG